MFFLDLQILQETQWLALPWQNLVWDAAKEPCAAPETKDFLTTKTRVANHTFFPSTA